MYAAVVISLLIMAAIVVTQFVFDLRRPLVRPVHPVGNLRQHVGHDLSELGGLSQSNHAVQVQYDAG